MGMRSPRIRSDRPEVGPCLWGAFARTARRIGPCLCLAFAWTARRSVPALGACFIRLSGVYHIHGRAGEEGGEVACGDVHEALAGFEGGPGDVWGEDEIGGAEEWVG